MTWFEGVGCRKREEAIGGRFEETGIREGARGMEDRWMEDGWIEEGWMEDGRMEAG